MTMEGRLPLRIFLATLLVASAAALVIYWLPQLGGQLQTDVTWIYRIQTTPPASLPPVPEGLRLFSGAPMGWLDACQAHLEAFRRLNCGDIALWRLSAILAGDDLHSWLAISLAFNTLAVCLIGYVLWSIGTPWFLALCAMAGLFMVPSEIWVSAVTSESRVFFAFAAALAAAASGRHWLAAFSMLAMVAFKEPSFVWWPLVAAFSVCSRSMVERRQGLPQPGSGASGIATVQLRALVPHIVVGTLAIAAFLLVWLLVKVRHDYPFLLRTPYADPAVFLPESLVGMVPPVFGKVRVVASSTLALAVLAGAVWFAGGLNRVAREYRFPRTWLVIAAGLAGLAGHLAVHWLTRRTIGDTRYVVPANIGLLIVLLSFVNPVVNASSRIMRIAAALIVTVGLFLAFPWKDKPVVGIGLVGAGAGLVLAWAFAGVADLGRRRWKIVSAAGLATGFLIAPAVDSDLNQAGAAVADSRSWRSTAADLIATLPPNAFVDLKTSDAMMIETAWSLQAEFLFARRGDVEFWLTTRDTSFFEKEGGLVRSAHETFNFGRTTAEQASATGRPMFELTLDRSGNRRSRQRPASSTLNVVTSVLSDPGAFFNQRYLDWRAGYLVAKLDKIS